MKITDISADYNPFYNPATANNGGGYFQPYGTCSIMLKDGTTFSATYEDRSCGDFGDRWFAEFIAIDGETFNFSQDYVDNSYERHKSDDNWNTKTANRMYTRFGINAWYLIDTLSRAISSAAWEKYLVDSER